VVALLEAETAPRDPKPDLEVPRGVDDPRRAQGRAEGREGVARTDGELDGAAAGRSVRGGDVGADAVDDDPAGEHHEDEEPEEHLSHEAGSSSHGRAEEGEIGRAHVWTQV